MIPTYTAGLWIICVLNFKDALFHDGTILQILLNFKFIYSTCELKLVIKQIKHNRKELLFLKIYFGETQIKSAKQFAGSFRKKTLQLEAHAASKKKTNPLLICIIITVIIC